MIKIVALTKQGHGSKYHRVHSLLETLAKHYDALDIKIYHEKYITEEVVKDCDILYLHWTQLTQPVYLSLWRDKYGFKIVQDVDDYWQVPSNHPSRDRVATMIPLLLDQIILADVVLCTTEALRDKILPYNKEVVLRRNFLPISINLDGQFDVKLRDFYRSNKLNIGICGSLSHLPDYLEINKDIKKLMSDKFIMDNVNLVVSGYSDTNEITKKYWTTIINVMTYGKPIRNKMETIKPKIYRFEPSNSYMKLYDDIDILLCPLSFNEFNRCKSELKLLEAGIKGCIAIGNNGIYEEKLNLLKGDQIYIESNKDIVKKVKEIVKLWKTNRYAFTSTANVLQSNTLSYNNTLEREECKTVYELFLSLSTK